MPIPISIQEKQVAILPSFIDLSKEGNQLIPFEELTNEQLVEVSQHPARLAALETYLASKDLSVAQLAEQVRQEQQAAQEARLAAQAAQEAERLAQERVMREVEVPTTDNHAKAIDPELVINADPMALAQQVAQSLKENPELELKNQQAEAILNTVENISPTPAVISSASKPTKPVIPYAFIRFMNEKITMQQSLDSIVPFFEKGVIIYHELLPGVEDDGSLEIAQKFVRKHPGFKLYKYPMPVVYHNSKFTADNITGDFDRTWLLDSFYNYGLAHVLELAKANGELDHAWIVKIDLDHIYSQRALEYVKSEAERLQDDYDSLFMSKVNVSYDYYSEINKSFFKPGFFSRLFMDKKYKDYYLLNKRNFTKPGAFISLELTAYDHFFAKASVISHFVFINAYDPDWRLLEKKPGVNNFDNWERCIFVEEVRHYVDKIYGTSFHFNREKNIAYNGVKDLSLIKPAKFTPYTEIPPEVQQAHAQEIALDPEFWSPENLRYLISRFKYPEGKAAKYPQLQYSKVAVDFAKLQQNPDFRIKNFIDQFNARRSATPMEHPDRGNLDLEAEVLTQLFHKFNKGVTSVMALDHRITPERRPVLAQIEAEVKAKLEQEAGAASSAAETKEIENKSE